MQQRAERWTEQINEGVTDQRSEAAKKIKVKGASQRQTAIKMYEKQQKKKNLPSLLKEQDDCFCGGLLKFLRNETIN